MAARPTEIAHTSGPPGKWSAAGSAGTIHTGSAPLSMSSSRVTIPSTGPRERYTLVAPRLPEPSVRTSTPRNQRPSHRPHGRAPHAYPIATHSSTAWIMVAPSIALPHLEAHRRAMKLEMARQVEREVALVAGREPGGRIHEQGELGRSGPGLGRVVDAWGAPEPGARGLAASLHRLQPAIELGGGDAAPVLGEALLDHP